MKRVTGHFLTLVGAAPLRFVRRLLAPPPPRESRFSQAAGSWLGSGGHRAHPLTEHGWNATPINGSSGARVGGNMQRRLGSVATAWTAAIATALSLVVVGALPAAAVTSIPTYTWTGTDVAAPGVAAPNWSDANNWTVSPTNAAPAPQPGATVDVVFPPASCAGTACDMSNMMPAHNDLTGLTVNNLTIEQVAPSQGAITPIRDLTGNQITLNGLLARSNMIDGSVPVASGYGQVGLPIVLGANQTWTLSGGVSLGIRGAVTGSSSSLAVTLGGRSRLLIDGAAVSVGPVTVTGADPSRVDGNSFHNGYLSVVGGGSVNGTGINPNSVTVTDVHLNLGQSTVGPLTISGTGLSTGDGGGSFAHPGVALVQGSLALNPSGMYQSIGIYPPSSGSPIAGFDSSELTATGDIALNSAPFLLQSFNFDSSGQPDCNSTLPVGAVYTLVAAGGTLSGTFTREVPNGSPINDGDVVPVILGCADFHLSALVRINYTAKTVTATVLPALTAPTIGTAIAGPAQATVTFIPPVGNAAVYPPVAYVAFATDLTTPANGGQQGSTRVGSNTITIPNLISGDQYTFSVQAGYDRGYGPASAASNSVTMPTGSTAPTAPTIVGAAPGDAEVLIDFVPPTSNGGTAITGYTFTATNVTHAAVAHKTVSGSATPITISGLTNGDSYTFTVTATNAVGTSPSSEPLTGIIPTASASTVPTAPTGVTATPGNAQAVVSWTAPANDGGSVVTGYTITATPGGQSATTIGGVTTGTVIGLNNGTSYAFTVTATNGAGNGSPSAASTPVTPVAPTTTTPPTTTPPTTTPTGTVNAGGNFNSDPAGTMPTALNPVVVSITSPVAGSVSVVKGSNSPTLTGYRALGVNVQISAPPATAAQPLKLTFQVYVGALPAGTYPSDVTVFRDSTPIPACPGASTASPDPCVSNASVAGGVETFTVLSSHASSWDFETSNVGRLAGADRFDTAAAISQAEFPNGKAGAVVLARGDDYPDALVAGPLAAAKNAPLLLTVGSSLPTVGKTELQRVLPTGGKVYILGGTGAVPASVATQLTGLGYQVVRYGGADRFATAVQVADALGDPGTVLLATGTNFPDALSAGVAAAKAGGVVLLTNGNSLPSTTSKYLAAHGKTVYAVGGPAAAADKKATPLLGVDRYATSVALVAKFFSSPSSVGVASGTAFPDALSGGALLAHAGMPLLLAAPGGLPTAVGSYLSSVKTSVTSAHLFGGVGALGIVVQTAVGGALGQ